MATKEFKDPVHGYVSVPEAVVERVVDTAPFQRLRHVRQLSATYLVYPGANHTRFEHSLGVYHLATRVFRNLRDQHRFRRGARSAALDDVELTLQCAALLHDVGHPPLSHLGERHLDPAALRERLDDAGLVRRFEEANVRTDVPGGPFRGASPHELLSCVVVLEQFADPLWALGVDPYEVCGYVLGYSLEFERTGDWHYGVAAEILHSPVDVDRLDYLVRDGQMTGAEVLSVDIDRMVDAYTAVPDAGLALRDKALSTVGNYLEGRVALYMWVTQHHKAVYANVLLRAMLSEYADLTGDRPLSADEVLDRQLDDYAAMERLRAAAREHPDSTLSALHDRFRTRSFPESCWKHPIGFDDAFDGHDTDAVAAWLADDPASVAADLAAALDVPDHEVWVARSYVPEYEPEALTDVPVAHREETRSVADHGLYAAREFEGAIPFVYVPEGRQWDAVEHLERTFAAEASD